MAGMSEATERCTNKDKVVTIDTLTLDEVSDDDKPLVQNVIYAILACKHPEQLCTSWSVACTATHYVVTGVLPTSDFDINLVDLELINSVNPLRITSISIVNANDKNKLVVKVLNKSQRIQLTEGELIITQKRQRLWM